MYTKIGKKHKDAVTSPIRVEELLGEFSFIHHLLFLENIDCKRIILDYSPKSKTKNVDIAIDEQVFIEVRTIRLNENVSKTIAPDKITTYNPDMHFRVYNAVVDKINKFQFPNAKDGKNILALWDYTSECDSVDLQQALFGQSGVYLNSGKSYICSRISLPIKKNEDSQVNFNSIESIYNKYDSSTVSAVIVFNSHGNYSGFIHPVSNDRDRITKLLPGVDFKNDYVIPTIAHVNSS